MAPVSMDACDDAIFNLKDAHVQLFQIELLPLATLVRALTWREVNCSNMPPR